jgi:hypothetical protein
MGGHDSALLTSSVAHLGENVKRNLYLAILTLYFGRKYSQV